MRTVILAAIAVCMVIASPVKDDFETFEKERSLYPRYIQMTDGDGEPQLVDLDAPIDYKLLEEIKRNPDNNAYWLYTRNNPQSYQILTINDAISIQNSNFDANRPTLIIVHGWLSTGISEPNPTIKTAYLDKQDANVITVDWRRLAMSDYVTASAGIPAVGEAVGDFINWLNQDFGLPYDQVFLVGFSLGAHLVGNAGRATGGAVARVQGLDPSGPLWNFNSARLSPTDGVYVEAIHTDGGYTDGGYGIGSAIAQVDFFPNGGLSQPGCYTNLCNHRRAWEFFAATITYDHLLGYYCTGDLISWITCNGASLRMGNDNLGKTGTPGSYRVETASRYPF